VHPDDGEADLAEVLEHVPLPLLVLSPELIVRWANLAYLEIVGRRRETLLGRQLWEAFPPTGEQDEQDVVAQSLQRVCETGEPDSRTVRYDLLDEASGELRERHWRLGHFAVHGRHGELALLVQWSQDVTEAVREHELRQAAQELSETWRERAQAATEQTQVVTADLQARGQQLSAAQVRSEQLAAQLASLSSVALLLGSVDTLEELEQIAVGSGLEVLGVDVGALVTASPGGSWRVSAYAAPGRQVQVLDSELPGDSPLPAAVSAREGRRILLPQRDGAVAHHPAMQAVYADTGCTSWAYLPLLVRGRCLGSLALAWSEEHEPVDGELDMLEGFAAQCAQSVERLRLRHAEREAARATAQLAEALQRSLLTSPPAPAGLDIAVRYSPSTRGAEVGGDWYDAFLTRAGATLLVVGDVTGHDRHAAAVMGQLRNLLRGLAYDSADGPAALLTRLDRALEGLSIPSLATAVLARVDPLPGGAAGRRVHWSSAGHPPPLVRRHDGTVEVLARKADLLLGLDPALERQEHDVELAPGDTLVLYTDGLVEVRTDDLDVGIDRLARTLHEHGDRPPEQLCDRLLGEALLDANDDDIALLVVRVEPPGT